MPIELAEDKNGKKVKTPKKYNTIKQKVIARNHRTHRRRKRCKTLETTLE